MAKDNNLVFDTNVLIYFFAGNANAGELIKEIQHTCFFHYCN